MEKWVSKGQERNPTRKKKGKRSKPVIWETEAADPRDHTDDGQPLQTLGKKEGICLSSVEPHFVASGEVRQMGRVRLAEDGLGATPQHPSPLEWHTPCGLAASPAPSPQRERYPCTQMHTCVHIHHMRSCVSEQVQTKPYTVSAKQQHQTHGVFESVFPFKPQTA